MNKVHLSIRSHSLMQHNQYGVCAYAYIIDFIENQEKLKEQYSACFYLSTHIRAELIGLIHALEKLEPCVLYIYTNNNEIVSNINRIQFVELSAWDKAKNADLWNKLIPLLYKHTVICIRKENSMPLSDCKKELKRIIQFPCYIDMDEVPQDELKKFLFQLEEERKHLKTQIAEIEAKKSILRSSIKIISEFERNYEYIL